MTPSNGEMQNRGWHVGTSKKCMCSALPRWPCPLASGQKQEAKPIGMHNGKFEVFLTSFQGTNHGKHTRGDWSCRWERPKECQAFENAQQTAASWAGAGHFWQAVCAQPRGRHKDGFYRGTACGAGRVGSLQHNRMRTHTHGCAHSSAADGPLCFCSPCCCWRCPR